MSEKGKFIVIEGIDGAGKSTQARLLKEKLLEKGLEVELTREPSNSPIGKILRQVYLPDSHDNQDEVKKTLKLLTIGYLMTADRMQHISYIKSKLDEGVNVICDRYVMSSLAYDYIDTTSKIVSAEHIMSSMSRSEMLNQVPIMMLKPDITIFLNLAPSEALARISDRFEKDGEKIQIFENKESLQLRHVLYKDAMEILRQKYHHDIRKVKASGTEEDIATNVFNIVAKVLNTN